MIDFLKEPCIVWGQQRRRQILGGTWQDGKFYPDGHNHRSDILRFKELMDGASSTTNKLSQFTDEGLTGDALLIARCIKHPTHMPEYLYMALLGKYAFRIQPKALAPMFGVSIAEFWRMIDRAHHFIAGRFEPTVETV